MRKNLKIFILGVFSSVIVITLLGFIIEDRLIKLGVTGLVLFSVATFSIKSFWFDKHLL